MRASTPRTSGSWTRQPLETLWKMGGLAGDYWAPPQMTLVPASTQFGRLEHAHGPLALLLTVSFRNESARHYLAPLAGHSRCRHLVPAHAVPGGSGTSPLPPASA